MAKGLEPRVATSHSRRLNRTGVFAEARAISILKLSFVTEAALETSCLRLNRLRGVRSIPYDSTRLLNTRLLNPGVCIRGGEPYAGNDVRIGLRLDCFASIVPNR